MKTLSIKIFGKTKMEIEKLLNENSFGIQDLNACFDEEILITTLRLNYDETFENSSRVSDILYILNNFIYSIADEDIFDTLANLIDTFKNELIIFDQGTSNYFSYNLLKRLQNKNLIKFVETIYDVEKVEDYFDFKANSLNDNNFASFETVEKISQELLTKNNCRLCIVSITNYLSNSFGKICFYAVSTSKGINIKHKNFDINEKNLEEKIAKTLAFETISKLKFGL